MGRSMLCVCLTQRVKVHLWCPFPGFVFLLFIYASTRVLTTKTSWLMSCPWNCRILAPCVLRAHSSPWIRGPSAVNGKLEPPPIPVHKGPCCSGDERHEPGSIRFYYGRRTQSSVTDRNAACFMNSFSLQSRFLFCLSFCSLDRCCR